MFHSINNQQPFFPPKNLPVRWIICNICNCKAPRGRITKPNKESAHLFILKNSSTIFFIYKSIHNTILLTITPVGTKTYPVNHKLLTCLLNRIVVNTCPNHFQNTSTISRVIFIELATKLSILQVT